MNQLSVKPTAQELASQIKAGKIPKGFDIPKWNSSMPLYDHQMQAALWMYLTPKGILADDTGLGKTCSVLALLHLLKQRGKLGPDKRAIIIVPAISVLTSWKADGFDKFGPDLKFAVGRGTPKKRKEIYNDDSWEVLLTNYELVRTDRKLLEEMDFRFVALDEADYIKNHAAQMTQAVKAISVDADRVVAMTATPIQNSLLDLHSILEAMGLNKVFGSKTAFDRRYHEHKVEKIRTRKRTIYKKTVIGYKNTQELKKKLAPYYLRRTYTDLGDMDLPDLRTQVRTLEMTPEQKQMYADVKRGFAHLTPNSPPKEIRNAVFKLRQVCTGTYTAGAEKDSSCKLDWLERTLQTGWLDTKVVIFSSWKTTIYALEKRLDDAGLGYVTITADDGNQKRREEKRQKFWNDPKTNVLIGTTAIEKSLNLQCANVQVNIDMLYNPAKHHQLAGRVRRMDSVHDEAWVISLQTESTIEAKVMKTLEQKQAISNHIFGDSEELFDALSPQELLDMIRS